MIAVSAPAVAGTAPQRLHAKSLVFSLGAQNSVPCGHIRLVGESWQSVARHSWLLLVPALPLVRHGRRMERRCRYDGRSSRVFCRSASEDSERSVAIGRQSETAQEATLRLSSEISDATEAQDLVRAAKAQRELKKMQLEMPSAMCRHLIHEDCRLATLMLRQGHSVPMRRKIKSVRKLGRWLRWSQAAKKDLVPFATVLEGLLFALRSEPEVAWAAQCTLHHVACCAPNLGTSVRASTRGTIMRMLLNEKKCFPFCLPDLAERTAKAYEQAMNSIVVQDFFSQLKRLSLVDPGYGDNVESYDLVLLSNFTHQFGRSLCNLVTLEVVGFEDCAMMLVLPALRMPKLQSLHIIGACQSFNARRAILTVLQRHSSHLQELELNVWTELLCEADDPLMDMVPMPQVKKLSVRAPPRTGTWEYLSERCPSIEEITFLYDQDFALNSSRVMEDYMHWDLGRHTRWLYQDAAAFADDLHSYGFERLAECCPNLKVIRLALADNSFGYDTTLSKDRLSICWRRSPEPSTKGRSFQRDSEQNNSTRALLEARSTETSIVQEAMDDDEEDDHGPLTEEEARSLGARVMLQVFRLFDDASLEASFGL